MSQFEEAIAAVHELRQQVDRTVAAIRRVDKLAPSQVRTFNGEIDDMMTELGKLQPSRERLLQRTQQGAPDLAIAGAETLNGLPPG
jgi:hypothetical protein